MNISTKCQTNLKTFVGDKIKDQILRSCRSMIQIKVVDPIILRTMFRFNLFS